MSKTAFVLSGGGAKGSFQAGVVYQLLEQGITPDVVYGTSVGAINAAGMSYLSKEEFLKMWLNIKGDHEVIWPAGWKKYLCWPKVFWTGGFYSLAPLRKSLGAILKDRTPSYEAVSCYVDLPTGAAVFCSNKQYSKEVHLESVLASAAIPMLMEDQSYKVDGGIRIS